MTPATRRDALRLGLSLMASGWLRDGTAAPRATAPPPSVGPCRGSLIGMSRLRGADGRERFAVVRVDLHERPLRARPIAIPFFGHGVAFDPRRPQRALIFEKHGPGCCEVDLLAGRMTRVVPPTPGRQFYGHGVFSADGARVFATETATADGSLRGFLVARDGSSLKALGDLDSHGRAPHDVVLADGGRALLVGNGGAAPRPGSADPRDAPSLVWLAQPGGALQRRLTLDDLRLNVGHIALLPSHRDLPQGGVAVVSAPRDGLDLKARDVHGGVSFVRGAGATAQAMRDPRLAELRGETLSLAVGPGGVVYATSPEGGLLLTIEAASGRATGWWRRWAQPRGVALDVSGRCLGLAHGAPPELRLLDAVSLATVAGGHLPQGWISGSHLYGVELGVS